MAQHFGKPKKEAKKPKKGKGMKKGLKEINRNKLINFSGAY